MAGYAGMDVDLVAQVARGLHNQQRALETITNAVQGIVDRALHVWDGADAHSFNDAWRSQHRGSMQSLAAGLEEIVVKLKEQIAEQERASGGSSGATGGGGLPGIGTTLPHLPRISPGDVLPLLPDRPKLIPDDPGMTIPRLPGFPGLPGLIPNDPGITLPKLPGWLAPYLPPMPHEHPDWTSPDHTMPWDGAPGGTPPFMPGITVPKLPDWLGPILPMPHETFPAVPSLPTLPGDLVAYLGGSKDFDESGHGSRYFASDAPGRFFEAFDGAADGVGKAVGFPEVAGYWNKMNTDLGGHMFDRVPHLPDQMLSGLKIAGTGFSAIEAGTNGFQIGTDLANGKYAEAGMHTWEAGNSIAKTHPASYLYGVASQSVTEVVKAAGQSDFSANGFKMVAAEIRRDPWGALGAGGSNVAKEFPGQMLRIFL